MLKWLDEHFEECLLVLFLVLIACVMMLLDMGGRIFAFYVDHERIYFFTVHDQKK